MKNTEERGFLGQSVIIITELNIFKTWRKKSLEKLEKFIFNDMLNTFYLWLFVFMEGARCSSVVRTFARGAMGRQIDPSYRTH